MLVEYIVLAIYLIALVVNLIVNKNKPSLIKGILGVLLGLTYLLFYYIEVLKPYMWAFDGYILIYMSYILLTLIPKRITNTITEYDYVEVERAYRGIKDEHEVLRERFISTISLIEEGVIFYEDGFKEVFLSDKAQEIFGGERSVNLKEHVLSIFVQDRNDYIQTIEHLSKRYNEYKIKYRIEKGDQRFWVEERGNYINVSGKKTAIATVRVLEPMVFTETSYFELDSMYKVDKLYTVISQYVTNHRKFGLVMFEITNIPEINKKYGREVGSLMMNDYIKYMKSTYQEEATRVFRVSGIRFAILIDDKDVFEDFKKALVDSKSLLYNFKIKIAGINDLIKVNFGVLDYSLVRQINSKDVVDLTEKALEDAIDSKKKNYSIFGE